MEVFKKVQSLLKAYDSCTNDVQCQQIRIQLSAMNVHRQTVAYGYGYPSPGDDQFACKIAGHPRFSKNAYEEADGTRSADNAKRICDGNFFALTDSQIFIRNFMQVYDNLLLFHGVGLGKTCTAVSVAEALYPILKTRVLVLLPQKLKSNFERQIYDISKPSHLQCTGTTYGDKIEDSTVLGKQVLSRKLNALVSEKYEIMSFNEFGNKVKSIVQKVAEADASASDAERDAKTGMALQHIMTNRLVIIDEVHNLKVGGEATDKVVPPLLELALKHAHNCKLLLMTATPMYDNAAEIVWLLNLMKLNADMPGLELRQVFDGNALTSKGAQLIAKAARGCVSYMRGKNPWTFPVRLFPSVNNDRNVLTAAPTLDITGQPLSKSDRVSQLTIIKSDMSAFQAGVYKNILSKTLKDVSDAKDEETSGSSLSTLIEASNVVYPSEAVGSRGLDECFVSNKTKPSQSSNKTLKTFSYQPKVRAQHGEFFSQAYISKYAPKIARIVNYIRSSEGFIYVYSRYKASGLIPLAFALEHAGFQRYNAPNLLTGIRQNDAKVTVGPGKKTARYAILSGEDYLSPHIDGDIRAMRSEQNAEGEVIKVVLCSAVGTEGIDFRHVREVHIMEPWFNMSRTEQIIGRGARQCSHFALEMQKRNVTVFHHATLQPASKTESIDYRIYRIAERKNRSISAVEKILQEEAVDCVLNKGANYIDPASLNYKFDLRTSQGTVLKSVTLGDAPDDKIHCRPCDAVKPARAKNITLYLEEDTADYKRAIASFYLNGDSANYDALLATCKRQLGTKFDEDTFIVALQSMIDSRSHGTGVVHITQGQEVRGHLAYLADRYVFMPESDTNDVAKYIRIQSSSDAAQYADEKERDKKRITSQLTQDTINRLQTQVQSTVSEFSVFPSRVAVLQRAVIDYFVDRLSTMELLSVIKHIVRSSPNARGFELAVLDSMRRGHVLHGKWPQVDAVFDGSSKTFWKVTASGEATPCDASQTGEIMKKLRSILGGRGDYVAAIEVSKNGGPQLKIFDGNKAVKGSICVQTSTFTVDLMKKWVSDIEPKLLSTPQVQQIKKQKLITTKLSKQTLCMRYELALRMVDRFARPLLYHVQIGAVTRP